MKTCNICQTTKPTTEFHKGTNGAKLLAMCKECRSKKSAEDYKANWFSKTTILKKSECRKKNILFDLDKDYLKDIWTDTCPVFGEQFVRHDKSNPFCPTLDRIIPSQGYTKGNVVWISSRANRIKYDATVDELKRLVEWFEGATTIPKGSTLK